MYASIIITISFKFNTQQNYNIITLIKFEKCYHILECFIYKLRSQK